MRTTKFTINPKFTFVTYSGLPELDPDDQLLLKELLSRGVPCAVAVWNDETIDWANAGICVIRSTWDYHMHYTNFLAWIKRVSRVTTLINKASLVLWNSDKRYLHDLESWSIPIIPTVFITRGTYTNLNLLLSQRQWERAVVKPALGLSTYGVKAVSFGDCDGQSHLDALLSDGNVLVQQFVDSVNDVGERAMVFFGGVYSHSVRKTPFQHLAPVGEAGETLVTACDEEIEFARLTISKINPAPVYARVDIVTDSTGQTRIMELELIEPTLYLSLYPPAVASFADVLCTAPG